ncbi:MAG TPA: elongation factor Ts [Gammaproteobacteria bacterium]|nr:elongation factor Ts [Gammaproteobacteria bacterium]
MKITASMVKELRERTGAGMMECKKALAEADGDMETAIENMRVSGLAKADKKSGRIAAEGIIAIKASDSDAAILEINSETDFVAKADDFLNFADTLADTVLSSDAGTTDELAEIALPSGQTVDESRQALVGKIGENIQIRRFERLSKSGRVVSHYLHGTKIGVLIALEGGDEALAKNIAMHIAASRPVCISEDGVPAELLEKEKAILTAEAKESGKPDNIIDKMIQGRLRKYLAEITLVGQPYVKDPDQTVGQLLKSNNATVKTFVRYEVGEGIEKKQDNFAEEVMAQAKGN